MDARLSFQQCHLQPELRQTACHHRIGNQFEPDLAAIRDPSGDDGELIRRKGDAGLVKQTICFVEQSAAMQHGTAMPGNGGFYEPGAG
ncbi:hypothetical protein D3C72_2369640 [compost metagenome]